MADPVRLPLVENVEPRLASSNKDGLSSNVFYDKNQTGQTFATKRPGITSFVSAQGQAAGIFGNLIFTYPSYIWEDSVYGNSRFVIVGHKDTIDLNPEIFLYSNSGTVWKQVNSPSAGSWMGVAWNGTVYCAIGHGLCATSPDGITWTTRTAPLSHAKKIASDGSRFVVVGWGGSFSNPNIAYSIDNGISWTTVTILEGGNAYVYHDIAWNSGAGLFAIVGGGNEYKVQTSPTGAVWTDRTVPSTIQRQTITASSNLFVAFRKTGDLSLVDTSSDGITWGTASLPGAYGQATRGSTWTGTKFIGTGFDLWKIITSPDGITWSTYTLPSTNLQTGTEPQTVAGNNNTSVIFGGTSIDCFVKYWVSTDNSVSYILTNIGAVYPRTAGVY